MSAKTKEVKAWKGSDWKSVDVTVGAMIKAARTETGMSQSDVGEKVGVSGGMISHWERGNHTPKGDQAVALCRVLGVDLRRATNADDIQWPDAATQSSDAERPHYAEDSSLEQVAKERDGWRKDALEAAQRNGELHQTLKEVERLRDSDIASLERTIEDYKSTVRSLREHLSDIAASLGLESSATVSDVQGAIAALQEQASVARAGEGIRQELDKLRRKGASTPVAIRNAEIDRLQHDNALLEQQLTDARVRIANLEHELSRDTDAMVIVVRNPGIRVELS